MALCKVIIEYGTGKVTSLDSIKCLRDSINTNKEDVLTNLANGFLVVTTKPFVEGEYISVDGVEGTVISISIFHTKLKTPNGQMIVVSNHTASVNNVTNYSRLPTRRIVINVPVSYKTGVEEVKSLIIGIAKNHPNMLKDPAPDCRLTEYGDSNLVFTKKGLHILNNKLDGDNFLILIRRSPLNSYMIH